MDVGGDEAAEGIQEMEVETSEVIPESDSAKESQDLFGDIPEQKGDNDINLPQPGDNFNKSDDRQNADEVMEQEDEVFNGKPTTEKEVESEKEIPLEDLDLPEDIVIPPMPPTIGVGAPGEPRLVITHIVNYNFKSYAGRQVLGPFHKSFSSIIGPNGSGKSNVIDSMLFVFGYRAHKIRSKKISVLIHNSENHKDCTSCTVEVFFQRIIDKEDDFEIISDSKFTVSRTAHKDNSSSYKINDKKVPFKQVAQFLRNMGIDLDHNRFLILQGEVEQIALMKPKAVSEHDEGMLEFLEDIIGSSRYKEAIEKLAQLVEDLNEERSEKLAKVKGVEKDKDELEPQRNEAVAYLKEQNEIVELQTSLIQLYLLNLAEEESEHKKKKEKITNDMSSYTESLEAILTEKKTKMKTFKKISKAFEQKEALFQEKQDKMGELEKLNVKIFEDRKHARNKNKELKTKIDKETKKVAEMEKVPEENAKQMEKLTGQLDHMAEVKEKAEKTLNEAMQSLNEETQELQTRKDEKENQLMHLMKDVNESKQKLDVAKAELDIYMSTYDRAVSTLQEIADKISSVKDKTNHVTTENKRLQNLLPKLQSDQQAVTQKLKDMKLQEADIEKQLKKDKAQLADAEHSVRSAKSHGKVLDFLMELKNSGKLPGIFGRLGDLGAIDQKFDIAISSCCPSLENVLVDNIETAQECVTYLKKNNVGKATFIALDKMTKYREKLRKKPNVNLERIVDLIKLTNEDFRVAFYHALRDTLVASDLPQASKVAYGKDRRWRVVTLKGELIDTSGTMTGGGNRIIKGRMGSKCVAQETVSVETINKMRKNAENLDIKFRKIRGDVAIAEEESEKLSRLIHNHTCKIKQLDMENNGLNSQLKQLLSQKPECEAAVRNSKPEAKKEKGLRNTMDEMEKTFKSASKKASKIEEEKNKIHQEIVDISSNKLKPAKDTLKKATSDLEGAKKKITKLKVGIKTAERNVEKGKNTIEALKIDSTENAKKLEELEKQWSQLETDGQALLEELEEVSKEKEEISAALQECQTFLQESEKKEKDTRESMKEFQHALEATDAAIAEHKDKVARWKDKLKRLKLNTIDKDEPPVLKKLSEDELKALDEETIKTQISVKEHRLSSKVPNMAAIEEYNAKENLYLQRVADLDTVTKKRNKHRMQHDELRKRRMHEFTSGFMVITNKLKEMYQMITQGGDAELEFVDSLDPFSEGIVFSVRPPKKSWKNICNLSGGEKTLSSLALVFALHHYRPTPLYVMDEIDAALDFKNVSIIAIYIKERTKNAQFIIISLRNNMFELADRLVGIYKTDNCTKSVNIQPTLVAKKLTAVK